MKKTWKIINQIRGKSKKTIKPLFIINNERIIERRIIANRFNDYFASIATKMNEATQLDEGIPIQNLPNFTEFMPKKYRNSMYLTDCTVDEIMEIIRELDNNKSSDIPISIIKKSAHITAPLLKTIFNNHMQHGTFPDELKIGKISPVYKKDNDELRLKITGLCPPYQYSGKFLKRQYTLGYIVILYLREYYMINNLDSEKVTPPHMH